MYLFLAHAVMSSPHLFRGAVEGFPLQALLDLSSVLLFSALLRAGRQVTFGEEF